MLRGIGYRVWRDDELPAHRAYADVIEERLEAAKAVVVIWSADAIKSEWVRSEANRAREGRKIVQVSIESIMLPMPFDQIQCADLAGWTGEADAPGWRKVVKSIAELIGTTTAGDEHEAEAANAPRAVLIADIEGASVTRLKFRAAMAEAETTFDATLRRAIGTWGGTIFRIAGDTLYAVFKRPADALSAAREAQAVLAALHWPEIGTLKVRMAIDYAGTERRGAEYFGKAITRCAKLLPLGHGGQVLMTAPLVESGVPGDFLGAHPLDDPLQSVGIYQGVAGQFPALRLPDACPTNLPRTSGAIIGREADLSTIAVQLQHTSLITLIGAGGVGKTRISIEAGLAALPDFEDGVWLVELAAVSDSAAVPEAVARAMNLELVGGRDPLDALIDRLVRRRCLIVLDNCEHVVDAVAALADAVLAQAPDAKMLATSQEMLGIDGEQVLRIRPLAEADAVLLFAARARAADAAFEIGPGNEEAATAICRRLDGVPLAIEMAASRAPSLGCDAVLQRLDDRFRILTGGRRMAMPRQRTLLATLDWSHDLLSDRDATVFRRLGVFGGSFSLDAASEIVAVGPLDAFEVIDGLANLVAKSLVTATTSDNRTRYNLLETTRAYARNRLAATDETEAALRRYAAWFAKHAAPGLADFSGQTSDEELAARYNAESGNIRRALEWAFDEGGDSELGLALLAASAWMWDDQALQKQLAIALPLVTDATPRQVFARLLAAQAHVHMMLSPARAITEADAAIAAVRAHCSDVTSLVDVLDSKGFALWFTGNFAEAEPISRETRALVDGQPPSRIRSQALGLEALLMARRGSPAEAKPIFDVLIAELRSFGANGLANFWQSVSMRFCRESDLDVEIDAWRALLSRIRPDEMSAAGTTVTVANELGRGLARRGTPADLAEAIKVARVYFKAGAVSMSYRFMPPMAIVAIKSGRAADAARIMGFADGQRREAGEITLTQAHFDEAWAMLEALMSADALKAYYAEGARLSFDAAVRLAIGENAPQRQLAA